MIGVSVRSNIRQIAAEFRSFASEASDKAVVRALNRALDSSQTAASKEIRKTYNVKAKAVTAGMRKQRARRGPAPAAILIIEGTRFGLIEFDPRERNVRTTRGNRRAVSVRIKVKDARKTVQSGFVAQTKGGYRGIFKRTGKGRYPIKTLRSISVPAAFLERSVFASVQAASIDSFDKNYRQQLRFLGSR